MEVSKTTLNRFSRAIKKRGLKRKWVAEKLEVSKSHLTNMLSGEDLLLDKHRLKLNEILQTNY